MSSSAAFQGKYYTLERDVRELQHSHNGTTSTRDYTLERDVRELQLVNDARASHMIIPLREMLGNYNWS